MSETRSDPVCWNDLYVRELRENASGERKMSLGVHDNEIRGATLLFGPDGRPLIRLVPRRMGFRPPR